MGFASSFFFLLVGVLIFHFFSIVVYIDINLATSATEEMIEASKNVSNFVEIGYISSVHGLQGEICIKPNTDFPELRFCKVGHVLETYSSSLH